MGDAKLEIVPCTIQDAKEYVRQFHRHHAPPVSGLFACAVAQGDKVVGVAIVGRPVGRRLQGTRNACSKLYSACWRASRALGYRRLVTYTLSSETGASLKASGFRCVGSTPGRSWSVKSRPRVDKHPLQERLRWEAGSENAPQETG